MISQEKYGSCHGSVENSSLVQMSVLCKNRVIFHFHDWRKGRFWCMKLSPTETTVTHYFTVSGVSFGGFVGIRKDSWGRLVRGFDIGHPTA